jgi:hypothetical protein
MFDPNTGNVHDSDSAIHAPVPESKHDHYRALVDQGNCEWRDDNTVVINDVNSPDPVVGHFADGDVGGFEYEISK